MKLLIVLISCLVTFGCAHSQMRFNLAPGSTLNDYNKARIECGGDDSGGGGFIFGPLFIVAPVIAVVESVRFAKRHGIQDCLEAKGFRCIENCAHVSQYQEREKQELSREKQELERQKALDAEREQLAAERRQVEAERQQMERQKELDAEREQLAVERRKIEAEKQQMETLKRDPPKPSPPAMGNAKPSTDADQRNRGIKGIVLMNGNVIEGQIISMSADIVKIRTKEGGILSYDFKKEVQRFITE